MNNWLNEEERKQEIFIQHENLIDTNLSAFYDLCIRVNKVKPGSLSISRLKVLGNKSFTIQENDSDGDGGRCGIWGKRGIKFSCSTSDLILIEIYIDEYHYNKDRELGDISMQIDSIKICKKCSYKDIFDWDEEKMLNVIKWLLLESDSINEYIQGKEVKSESTRHEMNLIKSKLSKLDNDLEDANKKLSLIEYFQIGRTKTEKANQINFQNSIINDILNEISILNKKHLELSSYDEK